jgi:hypothetical protein
MKTREEHIAFEMNYCQHYGRGNGADMVCKAGMDISKIRTVAAGERGITWGPCIEGHTLPNPTAYCQHWVRRTREMGEKRADSIARSLQMMDIVQPVVSAWRTWTETNRAGKKEAVECPVCKGRLHLSQSAYNGHVWGKCETEGCVAWMQ